MLPLLLFIGCMDKDLADPLTPKERAWLVEHDGKIRLGHDPNARPVDYLDENGAFKGLAADYVHLIEERLGFRFDILHLPTWEEVVEKARDREIDVLCTFTKTPEREEWMLFTEPYIIIPTVILTRDNIKGDLNLRTMKNQVVTFTRGWVIEDYLRQRYGYLNMLPAVDADEAMNNLITEKADAWVTALTIASIKIEDHRVTNLRMAGQADFTFQLAFASRKDQPILNEILKKGLATITEDERADIFNKWIHIKQQSIFESTEFWLVVLGLLFAAALPFIITAYWNKALKKKVKEKTEELEAELVERKKARDALHSSQQTLNAILEYTPAIVYLVDEQDRMVLVNRSWEKTFNVRKEDVIGKSIYDLFPEETADQLHRINHSIFETGRPVEAEEQVPLEDGPHVYISLKFLLPETPGMGKLVCGISTDMTDRKQAEAALRESEERFRASFEASDVGMAIVDLQGRFLSVNSAACRNLNYTESELLAVNFMDVTHPDDVERSARRFGQCLEDRQPYSIEKRYVTRDNRLRWGLTTISPVFDSRGDAVYAIAHVQDITERKEAENELRHSKQKFQSIVDNIAIGVALISPDMKILELNRQMSDWFPDIEPSAQPVCYQAFNDPPREGLCGYCPTCQTLRDGRVHEATTETPRASGTRNYRIISSPILDAQGKVTAAIEIVEDVTERMSREAQLRQTQKIESIGILAGGIAHDFNNILFPIVGLAELLLDDLPPGGNTHGAVKEILTAGLRGADLVKQILAFSRQSEHKMIPVRIQQILKEALKLARSTIPSYVDINEDIQSDCGLMMADPTQIHQVVMNILTNAYHAVESKGGEISIHLRETTLEPGELEGRLLEPGCYALLSISDTGHGIAPDILKKIFEPYFTTKESGKGTGLGLAVAYGIIKEHRGEIKAYSEEGVGSTFNIYLPLMDQEVTLESTAEVAVDPTGNERILLVDDEEAIVDLVRQLLERLGYTVTSFTGSVDALKEFAAHPHDYDLVITDMTMPNMTGDRLAGELLAIRQDIPVIICTGFSERLFRKNHEAIGIKGLLMKPVVRSELARITRSVLDEAGAAD